MAYLNQAQAFGELKGNVVEGIRAHFPMTGDKQSLHLESVEALEHLHDPSDLTAQHQAKVEKRSWAVPLLGTVALKNNETGAVVDRKTIKLADLPLLTQRHSYIVDGQEYQTDNQWRLKQGVYTLRQQNGQLKSQFNVEGGKGGRNFDIILDPETKRFNMRRGTAEKIPVYPLLKELGVDDDALEKSWGKDILAANRGARGADTALEQFYRADKKKAPGSKEEARTYFFDALAKSNVRPEATKLTLGKPYTVVNGDALHDATKKMIGVQRGELPEDERDSIVFKTLHTAPDFAKEALTDWKTKRAIALRVNRKINSASSVREVIRGNMFNGPVKSTFTENALARTADQINPVEMFTSSFQTTIMGKGGIQSDKAISETAKLISPSQLGFSDPIHTPEGGRTGVTLHLPLGVRKVGNTPVLPAYNIKTGKVEHIDPATYYGATVVMPDQVKWDAQGRPSPVAKTVAVSKRGNDIGQAPFHEADYVLRSPSQLFSATSNLIPFLGNNSGNRASYATHHIEQAISLHDRDAPLVQCGMGDSNRNKTFEEFMGRRSSQLATAAGKVTKVTKDAVHIQTSDGEEHRVSIYNNFPLNDPKAVLHSTPLVKVGDEVKKGQVVADTNFTKGGTLALGKNLRVAYIPFKGHNFEDGIAISETAAQKLASEHMHKPSTTLSQDHIVGLDKYVALHPTTFTRTQLQNLGSDGLVQVGTKVKLGDPLVVASKPFESRGSLSLSKIKKSLGSQTMDTSLAWQEEHPGEVVGVHKDDEGNVTVHVRTVEPAQVGDKLCFDEETEVLTRQGWKRVADVALEDKICCLVGGVVVYQQPTALHRYETGGRMYRIKSQQVDLFVTEGHRMFVHPRNEAAFGLYAARDVAGKRVRYLKNGLWHGSDRAYYTFPPLEVRAGQSGNGTRTLNLTLDIDAFLLLLGAYLSEGNIVEQPSSGSYGIDITQVKEPGRTQLLDALRASGITYNEHGVGTKVRIYSKQLMTYFKQFGHAADKFIPEDVFELSPSRLRTLFKWLMWGDGSAPKGKQNSYTTVSKRLADDVQRLCLHMGIAANVQMTKEAGPQTIKGQVYWCQARYDVRIVDTKLTPQVNHGHTKKQRAQEEGWVDNYERPVYCVTVPEHVIYVRRNGKPVWSGNSGRYGNKGVITIVLPDKEMPHTTDGKPIEVALNPSGIPGRMNMGQVLETAASKIALKTGKPYVVQSFEHGTNMLEKVKDELKQHGISDTEEIVDPVSGQNLGPALVGHQHMLKLNFQIDKKVSVRSGMPLEGAEPEHYDADTLIPAQGGHTGGQSMGNLGLYGMLAHGAVHNIREMQTWKSEGPDRKERWNSPHNEVWRAIQTGEVPPPPKKTFAFQKFEDMLRGAGIDVHKEGHTIQVLPLTNQQILKMSAGELPEPAYVVNSRLDTFGEPVPRKGGVFDPKITGGLAGKNWSHITLPEPVPNPVFEPAIRHVLGMSGKDYTDLVHGDKAIDDKGNVVEINTPGSKAGGAAIAHLLSKIDVKKDLAQAKEALAKCRVPSDIAHRTGTEKLDKLSKKVRYLSALDKADIHPRDAYVLDHIPVVPPIMRPVSVLPNGSINEHDSNGLYSKLGDLATQMKMENYAYLRDSDKAADRFNLYDATKALMGVGDDWSTRGEQAKGFLLQIAGSSPKTGYFQRTLLSRRQDMTMRATITPDASLHLDQVGLPEKKALDLFRPFVVKKLQDLGAANSPREAHTLLSAEGKKDPIVYKALDHVMAERPVILKRDPVLHQHSVQAFWAQRTAGKSIQIHPLTTGGFNADFDGDTMSVYVPIGRDAVEEAKRMMPSKNIYSLGSGKVTYKPTLESSLGLYKLSRVTGDSGKTFDSHADLLKAVQAGKLTMTDSATVGGKKTTAGRVMLSTSVPPPMQRDLLHDFDLKLDKKGIDKVYSKIAQDHRESFADSASQLMRLGYDASFGAVRVPNPMTQGKAEAVEKEGEKPKEHVQFLPMGVHSLSLNDFTPDTQARDPVVQATNKKVEQIHADSSLSTAEKEQRAVRAWFDATDTIIKAHNEKMAKNPNNLSIMQAAGVKPDPIQYRQLRIAPMLMLDSQNRIIPHPVTKSYAEGLDVASYWSQMSGARRGSVLKVQEVSDPGYFTKQLMNSTLGMQITEHDCGTDNGVHVHVGSQDVFDRTLAQDHTTGGVTYKKNTVVTPQVASAIKSADKNATLLVRSTLKCGNGTGVCQKCVGLGPSGQHFPLGTNVGLLATQTLGERATQLTLKAFHSGGVALRDASMLNDFKRVQDLTLLPREIPDAATLAMKDGTVEKIEKDPLGHNVWIGGVKHLVPNDAVGHPLFKLLPGREDSVGPGGMKWGGVQVGMKVKAGDMLTDPDRTHVNIHDLYRATGDMNQVQNHLVTELHDIYGREGIRRQNVETVVRALSDVTRVVDPGDHETYIKGQFASRAKVQEANKQLVAQGLQPVQHTPVLKSIKVIPDEIQEDWLAKLNHENLRSSIATSAAHGEIATLHGSNPIPGIAYGAEFGLTQANAFTHPHLKDVPKHSY